MERTGAGDMHSERGRRAVTILRLLLVYGGAELLLRSLASAGALFALQSATARAAGWIATLYGAEPRLEGCTLFVGPSTVTVSGACVPSSALAVTLALMLAGTRLPWGRRLAWTAVGVGAVLGANVVRVTIVAWLAWKGSPYLEAVHVDVLPVVLALTGIAVWWFAWGRGATRG